MKILISYETDETSKRLLPVALKQAKAFNAKVKIVHISLGSVGIGKSAGPKNAINQPNIEEMFHKEGISVEFKTLPSFASIGETIVRYAADNNIDMIVVGIIQKSRVGKIMFGSSSQYIILHAPCPVLSVN